MNALGIYSGIGSMLHPIKAMGSTVFGNIEPRDFEPGETFVHNFPGSYFAKDFNDIERFKGHVDIIVGHPSCGAYSGVNWQAVKKERTEVNDFVKAIQILKPSFFIMDNLPKVFIDYPAKFWAEELGGDYNILPRFVTSRNYGNAQIRKRVYLIGSLKELEYVPIPNEKPFQTRTRDVIEKLLGLEGKIPNHNDVRPDDYWSSMTNVRAPNKRFTYREMYDFVRMWPEGKVFKYYKKDGTIGSRIGLSKARWDGKCPTLASTARQIHPIRCTPFTIKEHLLLMGFPNDFEIIGMDVDENGHWKVKTDFYQRTNKAVCGESIAYFENNIKEEFLGTTSDIIPTGKEEANNEHVAGFAFQYCLITKQETQMRCVFCKAKSFCGRRVK